MAFFKLQSLLGQEGGGGAWLGPSMKWLSLSGVRPAPSPSPHCIQSFVLSLQNTYNFFYSVIKSQFISPYFLKNTQTQCKQELRYQYLIWNGRGATAVQPLCPMLTAAGLAFEGRDHTMGGGNREHNCSKTGPGEHSPPPLGTCTLQPGLEAGHNGGEAGIALPEQRCGVGVFFVVLK